MSYSFHTQSLDNHIDTMTFELDLKPGLQAFQSNHRTLMK